MVRKVKGLKVKSLKGKSLKKTSMVQIKDIVLPIITRSVSETSSIKYVPTTQIPQKLRPATKDEMDGILVNHPRYNGRSIPLIQEFDITSIEFLNEKEREENLSKIIEIIKYVDMDYKIDEDENGEPYDKPITLWEDMGIPKGDWVMAAEFFTSSDEGLGMTEKDMENLYVSIKELQGESVFTTIKKLESLSGRGMFEILALIDKVDADESQDIEDEAL